MNQNSLKNSLKSSLDYLVKNGATTPKIAIILGSGLGDFADTIEQPVIIATRSIPHYPVSTVPGHAGRWIFGQIDTIPILAVQGRIHMYEGYSADTVGYPAHLMASLGVQTLIVTTASGGIHPLLVPGDLMLIADHINLAFRNPLIGPPSRLMGARFVDMCQPYDFELIDLAEKVALQLGMPLRRGVFCWVLGPSYETAAEIAMLRKIGADAVSMSTVPEVLVARQRNMSVLGMALITNKATGLSQHKLSHAEVTAVAEQVKPKFSHLVREIIKAIVNLKNYQ